MDIGAAFVLSWFQLMGTCTSAFLSSTEYVSLNEVGPAAALHCFGL